MTAVQKKFTGFTLIELMVAMAAGMIFMTATYAILKNQQDILVVQQQVVDMQQNARAAMSLMKREIRMMGYDPAFTDGVDNDGDGKIDQDDDIGAPETSGAGIINAEYDTSSGISLLRFTADLNNNSIIDSDEDFTYTLVDTQLQRNGQIVAYDIEAVGFAYAFDNDDNGELDRTINGNIIWAIDSNSGFPPFSGHTEKLTL